MAEGFDPSMMEANVRHGLLPPAQLFGTAFGVFAIDSGNIVWVGVSPCSQRGTASTQRQVFIRRHRGAAEKKVGLQNWGWQHQKKALPKCPLKIDSHTLFGRVCFKDGLD